MSNSKIDMAGRHIDGWMVIREDDTSDPDHLRWICECVQCGTLKSIQGVSLRSSGKLRPCGCQMGNHISLAPRNRSRQNHGLSGTPEYDAWKNARSRCLNPNDLNWKNYGGRGITFDERWDDVTAFLSDVGLRPSPEYSLDRIDNDGPYAPGNVRWATRVEQIANQRVRVYASDLVRAGFVTWEQINKVRQIKTEENW